jgi:Holliday junction resolvase
LYNIYFVKESDLAKKIIKRYEKEGYEIYSEVIYKPGSKRADIIAVKDDYYISIETKMSMNLTLIEQSFFWKDKVHESYICFPSSKKVNWFAVKLCNDLGIGMYKYNKRTDEFQLIHKSSICKEPDLPKLYEGQKDSISGSKGGGYITPFKITCEKLINFVKENNESTLINAIKNIEHHYSSDNSAKNSLHKMINIGVIPELEIFRKSKQIWIKYINI